jgi:hypothetical protein
MQAGSELSSDHLVYLISKTFMNLGKQEKSFQRCVFLEKIENRINHRFAKYTTCKKIMQINLKYMHVKDKIPVLRTVKFAYPLNRYFSQITLTNRIYLYKISQIKDLQNYF